MRKIGRAAGHAGALIERGVSEFFADGCGQRAAAISYYALLSLFPLAILAVAVFGVVVNDDQARNRVIDFVLAHVPLQKRSGSEQLHSLLARVTGQAGSFGGIGIIGLMLAASGVMGSIRTRSTRLVTSPSTVHRPRASSWTSGSSWGSRW